MGSVNKKDSAKEIKETVVKREPNIKSHIAFLLESLQKYHSNTIEQSLIWHVYWSLSALKILGHKDNTLYHTYTEKVKDISPSLFTTSDVCIPHICNIYAGIALLRTFTGEKDIFPTNDKLKLAMTPAPSKSTSYTKGSRFSNMHATYNLSAEAQSSDSVVSTQDSEQLKNQVIKKKILSFLRSMKKNDGSFSVCENGESDIRGIYSAIAITKMLDIFEVVNEINLFDGSKQYLLDCQGYEGGFGQIPGGEAHGGYTYCGVAALVLLGCLGECNTDMLAEWLVSRQVERGFNGRTNKEADSCYGFWIGACFKMLHMNGLGIGLGFVEGVRDFILGVCEDREGGFRDKETGCVDSHHTCYSLFFLAMFDESGIFGNTVDPSLGTVIKKN